MGLSDSLRQSQRGFTLLELLVALGIFALLAAMAYGGLNNVMRVSDATQQHAERLAQLQKSFLWLARDIEQASERSIRDEYGDQQGAVQAAEFGRYQLELTRAGWRNPAGRVRSHLQRVAYGLRDGQLIRAYWNVLDRAQDSQPLETVLLEGVGKLELRFLDEQQQWHSNWPSLGLDGEPVEGMPLAIELTMETPAEGRLRRLFRVPGV